MRRCCGIEVFVLLYFFASRKTCGWIGQTASARSPTDIFAADGSDSRRRWQTRYDLGSNKNKPVGDINSNMSYPIEPGKYWTALDPVRKPVKAADIIRSSTIGSKKLKVVDEDARDMSNALWNEQQYFAGDSSKENSVQSDRGGIYVSVTPKLPTAAFGNIDLSVPESVYSDSIDLVWDLLKYEAYEEALREPLLVSFLYSTVVGHKTLESSLAFLLANRLQSPGMMTSTQLQSIIRETLESDAVVRRAIRADILAVRDRDPACNSLPDVFLYFKGFHALQAHRVAHILWKRNKQVLAHYLQSQSSQIFQIDIHPNATFGRGIMLDHGTGIVVGETAQIGHNCSILHHVTLGGSGNKGVQRHPQISEGVLLGAGATVLGPVVIGQCSQVGAGTLVVGDLPNHCVAVGVPARIIGRFEDEKVQPSIGMNQMIGSTVENDSFIFSEGI